MKLFELYELEPWMVVYLAVISFVLGAVFGSFLNCAAYRIARKQSFLKGRSKCPVCNHVLSLPDLIPMFSFLFSKGKCRYCGTKISARYPLTELCFGLIGLSLFFHDGVSVLFLRDFIFACCLFCLSLVDLEICEIPDGCLLIATLAWVAALPFVGMELFDIFWHVGAGLLFGIVFLIISLVLDKLLKKESLGGGDIKLLFVIGLYLGLVASMFGVIIAAILGLIFVRIKDQKRIPFGPFLSLAAFVMLTFGEPLVRWYIDLIF